MNGENFPILIITGRPAAGKSEVIDFLKKTNAKERLERFHIADFEELDDFLYVWESFEIDDILSRNGKPRVWSDEKYWFKDHFTWNLYIERIGLEYRKKLARNPKYHDTMTTLVEFARGGDNGIYEALTYMHEEILKRAALIYIRVSYRRVRAQKPAQGTKRPGGFDSLPFSSR